MVLFYQANSKLVHSRKLKTTYQFLLQNVQAPLSPYLTSTLQTWSAIISTCLKITLESAKLTKNGQQGIEK